MTATTPQDTAVLSPPVVAPISTCTSVVAVSGYAPGATIDIYLGTGASPPLLTSFAPTVPESSATNVSAALFTLTTSTTFGAGQVVRVVQRLGSFQSNFSDPVTVTTRSGNLPTPTISPPLYACGRLVAIENVERGMTVTLTNAPTTGGSSSVGGPFTALTAFPAVQTIPHSPDFRFRAQSQLCSATSAVGPLQSVIPIASGPPEPLAPPVLINGAAIVGQRDLDFDGAVFGAEVRIRVNGVAGGPVVVNTLPGQRFRVRLNAQLNAGDAVSVGQRLCATSPTYGPTITTGSCPALPPPQIRLPRTGDRFLRLQVRWPGATIRAFVGTEEVAQGSGEVIGLHRPLAAGEVVTVFQSVGTCTSSQGFRVSVLCTQQDHELDPSLGGPYVVGTAEYRGPTITLGGRSVLVRGLVRFPVDRAGPTQRLVRWAGPRPLVLVMHGRAEVLKATSPTTVPLWIEDEPRTMREARVAAGTYQAVDAAQGYNDLLDALARSGIIAVSIDAEDLSSPSNTFLDEGAELYVQHLAYWNGLRTSGVGMGLVGVPAADFLGRVDLSRVGLAGHSRGGERVTRVPARVAASSLAGVVTVRGGFLIAPLAELASAPSGMPFLVLGGSRDVDTQEDPIVLFDRMGEPTSNVPERFLEWVYGATHRDWNSRLTFMGTTETGNLPPGVVGLPAVPSPAEQAQMVRVWGRMWFDWILRGSGEAEARASLNGDSVVRGIRYDNVLPSHARSGDLRIDSFRVDAPTFAAFDVGGAASFTAYTSLNQTDGRTRTDRYDDGGLSVFTGFVWGRTASSGLPEIRYDLSPAINATALTNVAFRIAKVQCNGDSFDSAGCFSSRETQGLGVTVEVWSGGTSRAVVLSAMSGAALVPGRSVPIPWAYGNSTLFSTTTFSVPRTLRVPQACFGAVPSGFWGSLSSVRVRVANLSEEVALSDVSLSQ